MNAAEARFRQLHALALARVGQPGTYESTAAYTARVIAAMEKQAAQVSA